MSKFDITKFLYESLLIEQGEEQQVQQQQHQAQEEPTPQQAQQAVKPVSTPFDELKGSTINNIEFKPHLAGGAIIIKVDGSPLPFIISWEGDHTTIKYKGITSLT